MSQERRTRFRPKELAIILSHFPIESIKEIHSFRRGNPRCPKALITSESGRFVLKRRAVGHDDPYRVAMAQEVQQILYQYGYPVPQLIGTIKDGKTLLQAYGAVYELFTYLEGQEYGQSLPQTQAAGRALRRLHECLTNQQVSYQIPSRTYHDNRRVREQITAMLPSIAKHESSVGQEVALNLIQEQLRAFYDEAAGVVRQLRDPETAPVICHGDWHPGNLLFGEDEVVGVFDFDTVRFMPALEDVAVGCLQFSLQANGSDPQQWPAELDVARAGSFLKGYRADGSYTMAELELITSLMIEGLIAETVAPIAQTGHFAAVHGFRFLQMIVRKVGWMQQHGLGALSGSV